MSSRSNAYWSVMLVLVLALAALPAYAAFPGKNGRIAFGRLDPNVGWLGLFTANADGSGQRLLVSAPVFFSDWSPDGKRIAFDFLDADGNEQIGVINSDGSNFKQITSGHGIHEAPSWSPDGRQILYLRDTPEGVRRFESSRFKTIPRTRPADH